MSNSDKSFSKLYADGWSCRAIGRHFGLSHKLVSAALHDEGVEVSSRRPRIGDYATKANGRHVGGNRRSKAAA